MINYGIFIPTYKKLDLKVFKLLDKNPNLILNLCVRQEELDNHFYDSFLNNKNINLISLGYNIIDLGDTRERIIKYCWDNNIQYCLMCDDGIDEIRYENTSWDLNTTIEFLINSINRDNLNKFIVGYSFFKYKCYLENGSYFNYVRPKAYDYLMNLPSQIVFLDTFKLKEHNINYTSIKEHGTEDHALFGSCLKQGLIFKSDIKLQYSGIYANCIKNGGSHFNETKEDNEKRYEKMSLTCLKYLHMYGLTINKYYDFQAKTYLILLHWDLDYYRSRLVNERKWNQKLIEEHFEFTLLN